MILSSDISLYNQIWDDAEKKLKDEMGLFKRLIDIYLIACSIGIKEDKVVLDKDATTPIKTIGRNTYQSMINTNLKDMLDFMLQNALINSKTINFDKDERLKLAFDSDYNSAKLNAASFLTGFANYGIQKILENAESDSSIVAIGELFEYFTNISESRYDDILKTITLDEIK